jgi:hypothetical protein
MARGRSGRLGLGLWSRKNPCRIRVFKPSPTSANASWFEIEISYEGLVQVFDVFLKQLLRLREN